uniref:Cocaine- and amphetamine-regulated transcript protein n=1 Tax=Accipiter nisus TaxID=211598 RepID=A0A8B9RVH6_9AVES
MESAWLCLLCLASSGLILLGSAEPVLGPRVTGCCLRQVEALQEVLEKLGSRELPAVEKRLSWVPLCEPGDPCAVRRGARIGKLCSCPRGTACNLFVLKCS